MSRYKYCIVPMCRNTTSKTPDKLYFSVPRDPVQRGKWCAAMRRDPVKNKPLSTTSSRYVCEDHFDLENDMYNYMRHKLMGGRAVIKPGVLPHKFDCQKKNIKLPPPSRERALKRRRKEIVSELLKSATVAQPTTGMTTSPVVARPPNDENSSPDIKPVACNTTCVSNCTPQTKIEEASGTAPQVQLPVEVNHCPGNERTALAIKYFCKSSVKKKVDVSGGLKKGKKKLAKVSTKSHKAASSSHSKGPGNPNQTNENVDSPDSLPAWNMDNFSSVPLKTELVFSDEEFQNSPVSYILGVPQSLSPSVSEPVSPVKVKEEPQFSVDLPPENGGVSTSSDNGNFDVSGIINSGSSCDLSSQLPIGNQISIPGTPLAKSVAPQDLISSLVSNVDTSKEPSAFSVESRSLDEHKLEKLDEESVVSTMKIIYFQTKEDLPTEKFGALKNLLTDFGHSSLPNVSSDSLRDMEAALASVIRETIAQRLSQARWYSIIVDECMDVSREPSAVIYVKFAHGGKVSTHYLCLAEVVKVSAEQLCSCVMNALDNLGIDLSKCSSLALDGPSVIGGVRGEVAAFFKELNPHLLSVRCVAHRLSLPLTRAAAELPYLIQYRDILRRIHSYFDASLSNTKRLHDCVRNSTGLKVSSLENGILDTDPPWSALISVFTADKSPESQGLLKQTTSYMFLATAAMLEEVSFRMNELSTVFRAENSNFDSAQSCVKACIESLNSMRNETGMYLTDFWNIIPKEAGKIFFYEAYFVTDGKAQRKNFEDLMHKFLGSIIRELQERSEDLDRIGMFDVLLPSNLPDTSELTIYGNEEVLKIFQLLSSSGDYNEHELLFEWASFKLTMRERLKGMTLQEVFEFMDDVSLEYPIMSSVIEFALTIPLHTADCERGFRALNLIKPDLQNGIDLHRVNNLLVIKIEGPDSENFDFSQAFKKWNS